jgi:LuxR family maltose regulon positive regulatory protein
MYTLAWSPATEAYELYQTRDLGTLGIVPESRAWFAWLEQVSCFAFSGKRGHYTARKETRQRGDRYWYAYLSTGEHLIKKYLGKTDDLSLSRLEHIIDEMSANQAARRQFRQVVPMMSAQSEAQVTSPGSLDAKGAEDDGDSARHPTLAQQENPPHPLLATKLHVPRPRTNLVPRHHLIERLQRGVERALTLVSAPAGFGKTTVLAQWFKLSGMPVAWLSLEAQDNDPTRFLSYLIVALQTLDAQIGTTALALLRTPQPPLLEAILSMLISEVTRRSSAEFALVLDDYHVITAKSIQRGMTFLLEHLPPNMHLVLTTRADPPLPLARLRAQGQLCEVRTTDLRFGALEVSAFLKGVMGLDLEAEDVATLEQRTEGWIAGLQLAALSLQGRSDVSAFLAAFTGSHRFVLDYLSEEVLERQDASVQQFLLHTCILERLSGPLCDAVTGHPGSQAMLESLEKANLFLAPLDDVRGWYRYHHLFAEVLRSYLKQKEPSLISELHRRSSAWYEQHKLPIEAVQHALAVPDPGLAARLIQPIVFLLTFQGQVYTVLDWMNALPEALVRTRPVLCVYYASLLAVTNQLEAAEARLKDAEQGIQEEMPAEQAQTILGWVFAVRGNVALFTGDIPQAVSLEQQALELLPEAEMIPRTAALSTTIRAYLVSGDVTYNSEQEVATVLAFIRASDNLYSTVSSLNLLAHLHVLQGRLQQAAYTFAQVAQVVPRLEMLQTAFSGLFYYFALGDLLREWNQLEAAERHLSQGMNMINEMLTVEPIVAMLGFTALARLQQALGNPSAALATLERLVHLAKQRHFAPHLMTCPIGARSNTWLWRGCALRRRATIRRILCS